MKNLRHLVALILTSSLAGSFQISPIQAVAPALCANQATSQSISNERKFSGLDVKHQDPSKNLYAYVNHQSFICGSTIKVYVAGDQVKSSPVRIAFFRVGDYRGHTLRKILQIDNVKVPKSRAPKVSNTDGYFAEDLVPALSQKVAPDWTPGLYLLGVQLAKSSKTLWVYQPFVVSALDNPKVLAVLGFTTMQAYNSWSGKNAYTRVPVAENTQRFSLLSPLPYYEFKFAISFAATAENQTTYIGYVVDNDLESMSSAQPRVNPSVVLFPDHFEYASLAMRSQITYWRDHGTNLAFLSANSIYWPVTIGRNVNDSTVESVTLDRTLGTFLRRGLDEQSLVGQRKRAFGCLNTQLQVPVTSNWLFRGIDPYRDSDNSLLIGSEVDEVDLTSPLPNQLKVLAQTPVRCTSNLGVVSTITQYVAESGAGVLSIGSTRFSCALSSFCTGLRPSDSKVPDLMLRNIIKMTDHGPAGNSMDLDVVNVSAL